MYKRQAQTADEDDSRDDEVAGLGEIDLVLDHVAHTDCGDHAVEDEAHAADDRRGDRADQCIKLRGEREDEDVYKRQSWTRTRSATSAARTA